eukprot:TRINITY_DN1511_c0_g1_i1.p1 TRINITY_DN1511_c0_g1~~TRINITY_DN1511_c0_g1_i1.p1  ORF type:complete len:1003 (-),score=158.56 TRINITY_DN1511_c0_g1_i1:184-3192(-)
MTVRSSRHVALAISPLLPAVVDATIYGGPVRHPIDAEPVGSECHCGGNQGLAGEMGVVAQNQMCMKDGAMCAPPAGPEYHHFPWDDKVQAEFSLDPNEAMVMTNVIIRHKPMSSDGKLLCIQMKQGHIASNGDFAHWPVFLEPCGTCEQTPEDMQWRLRPDGFIENEKWRGWCLDNVGNPARVLDGSVALQGWDCEYDWKITDEQWWMRKDGLIENRLNPDKCIGTSSDEITGHLILENCDPLKVSQQWTTDCEKPVEPDTTAPPDGTTAPVAGTTATATTTPAYVFCPCGDDTHGFLADGVCMKNDRPCHGPCSCDSGHCGSIGAGQHCWLDGQKCSHGHAQAPVVGCCTCADGTPGGMGAMGKCFKDGKQCEGACQCGADQCGVFATGGSCVEGDPAQEVCAVGTPVDARQVAKGNCCQCADGSEGTLNYHGIFEKCFARGQPCEGSCKCKDGSSGSVGYKGKCYNLEGDCSGEDDGADLFGGEEGDDDDDDDGPVDNGPVPPRPPRPTPTPTPPPATPPPATPPPATPPPATPATPPPTSNAPYTGPSDPETTTAAPGTTVVDETTQVDGTTPDTVPTSPAGASTTPAEETPTTSTTGGKGFCECTDSGCGGIGTDRKCYRDEAMCNVAILPPKDCCACVDDSIGNNYSEGVCWLGGKPCGGPCTCKGQEGKVGGYGPDGKCYIDNKVCRAVTTRGGDFCHCADDTFGKLVAGVCLNKLTNENCNAPTEEPEEDDDDDGGVPIWVWILGGAAGVALLAPLGFYALQQTKPKVTRRLVATDHASGPESDEEEPKPIVRERPPLVHAGAPPAAVTAVPTMVPALVATSVSRAPPVMTALPVPVHAAPAPITSVSLPVPVAQPLAAPPVLTAGSIVKPPMHLHSVGPPTYSRPMPTAVAAPVVMTGLAVPRGVSSPMPPPPMVPVTGTRAMTIAGGEQTLFQLLDGNHDGTLNRAEFENRGFTQSDWRVSYDESEIPQGFHASQEFTNVGPGGSYVLRPAMR